MHNSGCSFVVVAPRHIWSCLPGFVLAAAELSARLAWLALCALLNRDCAFLLLPAFLPARWWFTSAVWIATRTRMKKMPGTSLKTPIAWVVILILSGRRYICFAMVDFFALGWNSESQLLLTYCFFNYYNRNTWRRRRRELWRLTLRLASLHTAKLRLSPTWLT